MIEVLGVIFAFLILAYLSLYVFFATVPTFGESLFTDGRFSYKAIGAGLWVILITAWIWFLSGLSWS